MRRSTPGGRAYNVPGPHTGPRGPTASASWRHSTRAAPVEASAPRRPVPGRWPPGGLLGAAAEAPDAGGAPAAVDGSPCSARAAPSPATTPSPREEGETDAATGSHRVGSFGPWLPSPVRSFGPLRCAACTVHTSQQYHRTTWRRLAPSERRGGIARQPRAHRLAFCGTQRHSCWGRLHHRVLDRRPVTAAAGAGRPWPTAAGAWRGAQAPAAAGQAAPARAA
jgi:hypothetical protein